MALRGWVKARDGRLYHPVVAEKAKEAWEARLAQRARTEAARAAREANRRQRDNGSNSDRTDIATAHVTPSVTENVTGSKGQGQGQGQGIIEEPPTPSPDGDGGSDRPSDWNGQWRGLRANGSNPRAQAAKAKAAAPPPPEPDHPLWPRCRTLGLTPALFGRWIEPLIEVESLDGRPVLIAPSRFHADHCRAEFAQALDGYDVRARPEAAHG
jgi:hypothetical protein